MMLCSGHLNAIAMTGFFFQNLAVKKDNHRDINSESSIQYVQLM
jgi:hypothetical protein